MTTTLQTIANDLQATRDEFRAALSPRIVRCRYLHADPVQCTGEAVDPDGDVLLCTSHLSRALQLIADRVRRS